MTNSILVSEATDVIVKGILGEEKGVTSESDDRVAIWTWARNGFLSGEKGLLKRLKQDVQRNSSALEYEIEKRVDSDIQFAEELKKWVLKAKKYNSVLDATNFQAKKEITFKAKQKKSALKMDSFVSEEGKINIDIEQE